MLSDWLLRHCVRDRKTEESCLKAVPSTAEWNACVPSRVCPPAAAAAGRSQCQTDRSVRRQEDNHSPGSPEDPLWSWTNPPLETD
ncbi:unnamed protein product [Merluccius merluccius]